jgi:hypothetical protein
LENAVPAYLRRVPQAAAAYQRSNKVKIRHEDWNISPEIDQFLIKFFTA